MTIKALTDKNAALNEALLDSEFAHTQDKEVVVLSAIEVETR